MKEYSKRYMLLGIEEGDAICDFCQKRHIQNIYRVLDAETNEILNLGCVCVRKALKINTTTLINDRKNQIRQKYNALAFTLKEKSSELMNKYHSEAKKLDINPFVYLYQQPDFVCIDNRIFALSQREKKELKRITK